MQINNTRARSFHRRHAGLSLIEVLFALAVMLIGLTAIAAIFPLAAHTQTRAFDEVIADHVARNAEAIIKSRKLSYETLTHPDYGATSRETSDFKHWTTGTDGNARGYGGIGDVGGVTHPLSNEMMYWNPDGTGSHPNVPARDRFHLEDRSFPSVVANPADRSFYWTALMRDVDVASGIFNHNVYVLVMKSDAGTSYGRHRDDLNHQDAYIGYGGINSHDPITVPKAYRHKLGLDTNTEDETEFSRMRSGSWVVYQQYPGFITPSSDADQPFEDVVSVPVGQYPEGRPIAWTYMTDENAQVYVTMVPPGERKIRYEDPDRPVTSPSRNNRRDSPLKRIRVFGGDLYRP